MCAPGCRGPPRGGPSPPQGCFLLECCGPLLLPASPYPPFPQPLPSFFRHHRLCPISCLCICCSFWLNSSPFTFPQGPTQSHPWGKLVRVPSPLASLRSLLLQRSVPFSRIITFLFFPKQIPSAQKPLNKKRNTCAVTTDSVPRLLLCRGNCTHHLHSLLTAASSSL